MSGQSLYLRYRGYSCIALNATSRHYSHGGCIIEPLHLGLGTRDLVLRRVKGGHLRQRNRDHVRSETLAVTAAAVIGAAGAAHPSREPTMLLTTC